MFKNKATRRITQTISLLILSLMLTSLTAQASPNLEFIGPEGGDINAKHNSYLLVPEGALGDLTAALDALDNAIALLETQYAYIDGLSTVIDDPSGEWVKGTTKSYVRSKSIGKWRGNH
ncbi:hypothetical protein H8E77_39980 [bacterium]|nr:hypothetical protein [bacterium]